ncbi:MAG TPA: hypothetical protein VLL52_06260 [Anaerolineae bacterium]|nr:hypothetical protein [Anaerolineae bacterium]
MVNPKVFQVDRVHGGIRFFLPFVMGIAYIIGVPLLQALLSGVLGLLGQAESAALPLACVLALPTALVVMVGTERWMLAFWPSGREVHIDAGRQVQFWSRGNIVQDVDLKVGAEPLIWYFLMGSYPRGGRERHIDGKWYCVACQVQAEGSRVIVFTFMPPTEAKALAKKEEATLLNMVDLYGEKSSRSRGAALERPKLPTALVTGEDGRFWLAERNRWLEGLEVYPDEFEEILELVQR